MKKGKDRTREENTRWEDKGTRRGGGVGQDKTVEDKKRKRWGDTTTEDRATSSPLLLKVKQIRSTGDGRSHQTTEGTENEFDQRLRQYSSPLTDQTPLTLLL